MLCLIYEIKRKRRKDTMQKSYNHFDGFLLQKMLWCKKDYNAFSEEERYQAYRMFLKRTGEKGKRNAATQTIQKRFGIGGQKRPNREGLFKLGFALELSDKEVISCNTAEVYKKYGLDIYQYRELRFNEKDKGIEL